MLLALAVNELDGGGDVGGCDGDGEWGWGGGDSKDGVEIGCIWRV